jgi:hypothetical protein
MESGKTTGVKGAQAFLPQVSQSRHKRQARRPKRHQKNILASKPPLESDRRRTNMKPAIGAK